MPPGDLADRGARPLGPGEGDALHTRIGDHLGDLIVVGEHVRVDAIGQPRLAEHPLDSEGGLRAIARVLEQDRVAQDQVRGREPCHLVIGVVPRHDTDQDADRFGLHDGGAGAGDVEHLVREELLGAVRIIVVDVRDEIDLATRLDDGLAHLERDERSQFFPLFAVERGDALDQGDPLLQPAIPPLRIGFRGAIESLPCLLVGDLGELGQLLAGCRIHCRVDTHVRRRSFIVRCVIAELRAHQCARILDYHCCSLFMSRPIPNPPPLMRWH